MEFLLVLIGILGFGYAGYLDLKTTEFPDWLPYIMITLILIIKSVYSLILGDFSILINSLIVGIVFLAIGFALYLSKQWGDGDAWLLGALGFLFPINLVIQTVEIPYFLTLLFNFFIVAFIYLVAYSISLGIRSPKTAKKFSKDLKKDIKKIVTITIVFAILCVAAVFYFEYMFGIISYYFLLLPVIIFLFLVFIRYGLFVEKNLFKKRIPVSKLRLGDVPVENKWRCLTEAELKKLKEKGGHIWIKEGVRFAPVFIITLLVTVFFGNLILFFI